jgi:GT2 family glycosyltransferase
LESVTLHAPAGTEIVVVDDGSVDGMVTTTAAPFPLVRTLRLPQRRGFCAAANAGIAATSQPIVELLNDDAEVTPGWADAALNAFADPIVGAVAPLILRWPGGEIGDARIDSAGDRYYRGGIAGKRGHGQLLTLAYLRRQRVFGASAAAAFYRRDALRVTGGFPEAFGAYFEDVDLSFRLHWAGYEVAYIPQSRVLHHVGASYGKPTAKLLEQQSLNEERVFWRNLPDHELFRSLPAHAVVLAAKAWRRWRAGELRPFLRGRLRTLKEIPSLLHHRGRLHAGREVRKMDTWALTTRFWWE